MRIFQKTFEFRKLSDSVELTIKWMLFSRGYHFPITYTIEDCIEWWCSKRHGDVISFEITKTRGYSCMGRFKYHGKTHKRKKVGEARL